MADSQDGMNSSLVIDCANEVVVGGSSQNSKSEGDGAKVGIFIHTFLTFTSNSL